MACDVDNVIYTAEDAVVAVGGDHGAVACEIGPVLPLLALRILAILCVILLYEAIGVAPDRLHDAGPWIANADVARGMLAGFDFSTIFIPDDRKDSKRGRASATRLHAIESGFCGNEEATS